MRPKIKYYPFGKGNYFGVLALHRMKLYRYQFKVTDLPYKPKDGVWCVSTPRTAWGWCESNWYICKDNVFYFVFKVTYNADMCKKYKKYDILIGIPDEFLTKEARKGRPKI